MATQLGPHRLSMSRLTFTMNNEEAVIVKKYTYYLICLSCCYILALLLTAILANRPVAVQLSWGTVHWPGGIFFFPFIFVTLDIITETYGPSASRSLILLGFISELLMSVFGIAVAHMGHPDYFKESDVVAYQTVFDSTFWFVISSFLAALLAELINNHYVFKWKLRYNGKWFLIRSILSIAIGQAVLTVLVDLLAFGAKYPFYELTLMMLHGYLWKMALTSLMIVPSWLIVRHLKSLGIDSYESSKVDANPFGADKKVESSIQF